METRQKQFSIWVQYVLEYCKENGIQTIMIDSFPLFENKKIERSLEPAMRLSIMDQLCQQGYSHREQDGVYLMIEKSVKDWAYAIYNWMIENGYRMEVLDTEEIRTGDRFCHASFYNINESIFKDCLTILVKDGKVGTQRFLNV
ncbi:hypothetical protein WA588_003758 [Blastocystis sp. NMH]